MIGGTGVGSGGDDVGVLEQAAARLDDISLRVRSDAASIGSRTPDLKRIATAKSNLIAGSATSVDKSLLHAVQLALDKLLRTQALLHQASVLAAELAMESRARALATRERLAADKRMEPR